MVVLRGDYIAKIIDAMYTLGGHIYCVDENAGSAKVTVGVDDNMLRLNHTQGGVSALYFDIDDKKVRIILTQGRRLLVECWYVSCFSSAKTTELYDTLTERMRELAIAYSNIGGAYPYPYYRER
jgi:hypothetical protein